MTHETRQLSMFGPRACIDMLMTPAYALAQGILRGISILRRKLEQRGACRNRARAIDVTMAALSGLDDHVLRDIGIRRDDIYVVATMLTDDPNADVRKLAEV